MKAQVCFESKNMKERFKRFIQPKMRNGRMTIHIQAKTPVLMIDIAAIARSVQEGIREGIREALGK